jgi:hypothetical protein
LDLAAVLIGMMFGGFTRVVGGMEPMALRYMSMVRGLLVIAFAMVLGRCAMMSRGMFVVFCCFSVMLGTFVLCHAVSFLIPSIAIITESDSFVDRPPSHCTPGL